MELHKNEGYKKINLPDICIDEQSAPKYCMREKLIIVNGNQEKIGDVKINVGLAQISDNFQFVIHTSSKFQNELNDVSSMSMTSRVRPSLTTLEETRHEFWNSSSSLSDRTLYLAKYPKKYYVSTKHFNGTYLREKTDDIPINEIYNFMSEGANIIILKNVAIHKLAGKLKTRTMIINGIVCKSALLVSQEDLDLDGVLHDATKVTRLIRINYNSTLQKLETWLNGDGQILLHKWNGSEFVMKIDNRIEMKNKLYTVFLEDDWENDLQLTSVFIDKVEKLKSGYETYMSDYPELKQLVSDFVMHTLRKKPDDVIDFAVEFFKSVAK